ncbi:hypothetical protein TNCV_1123151 [Trichonephila clavipes]|uniref:Uncharacterized protein n=1 Tax=Trichonephila clavipes TaxID=2585209 RepID=A0A8X6VA86_TRICX|nr:hypothetical protein TNCV_1123151 [Trichonephila clavipes]
MVSPAVQGQVRHPSIVPEFLRSTSCGMTSAHGHGAIVYCLNSGSEDRQTGRHNMLCEGDTRNRWRDGQVCPDVGQGTMAPWARRLECVLACYAQIGLGRREKGGTKKVGRERTEGEGRGDGRRRERRRQRRRKERQRGARLVWRKGLSLGLEWKNEESRWR